MTARQPGATSHAPPASTPYTRALAAAYAAMTGGLALLAPKAKAKVQNTSNCKIYLIFTCNCSKLLYNYTYAHTKQKHSLSINVSFFFSGSCYWQPIVARQFLRHSPFSRSTTQPPRLLQQASSASLQPPPRRRSPPRRTTSFRREVKFAEVPTTTEPAV